jgi:HK97 family phage major capsid protein
LRNARSSAATALKPTGMLNTAPTNQADAFPPVRAAAAAVRKLKDGQNNYLWAPQFVAGQPETLLGYPVVIGEQMDAVSANTHPIAFGNFARGYLLVDRAGLRITVDANITTPGRIKYFIRRREGGHVLNNDAIKWIKAAVS